MPMAPSKVFIAAPTAVSSWITFNPLSRVLLFIIISRFRSLLLTTLSMAAKMNNVKMSGCRRYRKKLGIFQVKITNVKLKIEQ